MQLVTVYNVTRNRDGGIRDFTEKNFSVEVDREKFNKLESKLLEKNTTKKQWLNQKIDEELKK